MRVRAEVQALGFGVVKVRVRVRVRFTLSLGLGLTLTLSRPPVQGLLQAWHALLRLAQEGMGGNPDP